MAVAEHGRREEARAFGAFRPEEWMLRKTPWSAILRDSRTPIQGGTAYWPAQARPAGCPPCH